MQQLATAELCFAVDIGWWLGSEENVKVLLTITALIWEHCSTLLAA
jgi:hypothetical protein